MLLKEVEEEVELMADADKTSLHSFTEIFPQHVLLDIADKPFSITTLLTSARHCRTNKNIHIYVLPSSVLAMKMFHTRPNPRMAEKLKMASTGAKRWQCR